MDNNTFTNGNKDLDNSKSSAPTIWNQKYFKFLVISEITFILSLIIFMTLGTLLLDGHGGNITFIVMFISCATMTISGITAPISTLYTFFKTIKKKDPMSHAHNIFSRYILVAYLVSAIYLFLIYKAFDLYLYLNTNNLEFLNYLPFLLINIAGFIHLIILNNKYIKHR